MAQSEHPQIEHLIEVDAVSTHPDYSGRTFSDEEIAAGAHREFVGGHGAWRTHGIYQVEYMKSLGLLPHHRLLDVGCGSFRAGRHFIDYLDAGNYYGFDANHSLMQTGWDLELSEEQKAKTPITNLRTNDRFNGDFGVKFDFAIANSVFSHVSLNHIRLALYRLDKVMAPGGSFYATFFEKKASYPLDRVGPLNKKGKGFFTEKNNYWYYRSDLRWAGTFGDWKITYIGDWGHPANQKMMQYTKMTAEEIAERDAKARPSIKADLRKHAGRGKRWAKRKLKR